MKMRNRKEYKADAAERVAGLVSKKQRLSIVRTLLIAIMFLALPSKTFAQLFPSLVSSGDIPSLGVVVSGCLIQIVGHPRSQVIVGK
jgi:hypothetical protein